jgi:uncharacterized protein involved in high-affinity Fe2+ transport
MENQNVKTRAKFFRRSMYAVFALAVLSMSFLCAEEAISFPDGFRRWVHVGTGVIMPGTNPQFAGEEGMHHIFANQKAVEGYASGDFADGSMVVYELRETKQNNGVIFEGDRKRVDVMIKDSAHYGSTGGWRFQRFFGNDQAQSAIHDSGASCYQCHQKATAHGFIFSRLQ